MSLVLKKLHMHGFKSFAKKTSFEFPQSVTAIVGPNGSGKSNVVEAIRFVLGEQSAKSLRSKTGADLIFKGSTKIPHSNRASVSITFDNSKRMFALPSLAESGGPNLDFDEVVVSREVSQDGSQVYRINDSEVRMKDIHELIASVNIGTSGHHIISQGEADRLLGAKSIERREMLEESLGLRLYHYRIRETQKRLEKTKAHLVEVQSIRRELAPHIKFLKKQVEKIESAKILRTDLYDAYVQYLSHEGSDITAGLRTIENQLSQVTSDMVQVEQNLAGSGNDAGYDHQVKELTRSLQELKNELNLIIGNRDKILQNISRIDGMLEVLQTPATPKITDAITISRSHIQQGLMQIRQKFITSGFTDIVQVVSGILDAVDQLLYGNSATQVQAPDTSESKRVELQVQRSELEQNLQNYVNQYSNTHSELLRQEEALKILQDGHREIEGSRMDIIKKQYELQRVIDTLTTSRESLMIRRTGLENAYTEAISLLGSEIISTKQIVIPADEIKSHDDIRALHTQIERLKIKLEDAGGAGGTETIIEYDETLARDTHLESESIDIEKSITEMESTLSDLQEKLHTEFKTGIDKINTQFQEFFQTMFGGGSAKLVITSEVKKRRNTNNDEEITTIDEEEKPEIGVEIDVNLPRKKVKDLDMLSGGERSLTSIALLFALSQVNPPPFLVLDETDAALDEVNSRKYGDMIENLSRQTQLVVVTHNRETMSRADILYGVTLGSDDCSTTLSISFSDAEKIAK
jgi:chromosome segregation protein